MSRQRDETPDRDAGDASDADSDLEELQGDIAKFDKSVREFLASHRGLGEAPLSGRGGAVARGRGARGPRKAAKPRGDITARLSKVNQAFLSGDYDQALDLTFEVIRINAETHQAWTALSSIFRERGELDRALAAMVYAAHLRPKDVPGWLRCAHFALDMVAQDEGSSLHTARLCYSAALSADPANLEARLGKAAVCHQQGHLAAAIAEYKTILKRRPHDLDLVRKLAEACVDSKNAATAVSSAIQAYRHFFDHEANAQPQQGGDALWHDVGIYVELFASASRYREAIEQLKALSRWLVGRASEKYWDQWQADDREWDADDQRRSSVGDFDAVGAHPELYGNALPLDLRIRLATYRLKLGDASEALKHLDWLGLNESHTKDFVNDFPFLVYELATELANCGRASLAVGYYELLRAMPGDADPATLVQLGRCYLGLGRQPDAEECFLSAIDADEDSIDARIELANMYEKAREDEEALIFAAEAMALREAQDRPRTGGPEVAGSSAAGKPATRRSQGAAQRRKPRARADGEPAASDDVPKKPVIPRRYRAKRLAGAAQRLQDEQARALKLSRQYEAVRDLKQQIVAGRNDLVPAWMATSQELVDDFRTLKRFYTWDKYLHFLGAKSRLHVPGAGGAEQQDSELSQMYERLSRSVAPQADQHGREAGVPGSSSAYRGISFDDWLDLFLDYAIGLALAHRRDEANRICQAAKDSTVFQSAEHGFMIHVAWSVCAIYTNDEKRCVAIARHLMRDGATTDSHRMFALLSRLCQSPVSWYTSGPAQKFILRQIKAMDASQAGAAAAAAAAATTTQDSCGGGETGVGGAGAAGSPPGTGIDVCLLMLYGHILFTSTSYAYSLSYFLRARSLDANNAMVNLSLGLAYVHYGLKRQSANRQYLLLQGQAFLARYLEAGGGDGGGGSMAERLYNMGRLFQLLGIGYLSARYYGRAMEACRAEGGAADLAACIVVNSVASLMAAKNTATALALVKSNLRL